MSGLMIARIRLFVILIFATTALGMLDAVVDQTPQGLSRELALLRSLVGWTVGSAIIWGLEIFWLPSRQGAWLRRQHFVVIIMAKSAYTLASIVFVAWLMRVMFEGLFDLAFVMEPWFTRITVTAFAAVISLHIILQVMRIVGPRNLVNFVLGKYMRPVRENTIFMFLDLANSTALSEKFGDIGVQRMITHFFFDITEPIIEHGGTVHRYVGDQVVVTWPLRTPSENARAIICALAIRDFIEQRAASYEADFGIVPTFRIGLHGGHVVISQMGDQKQELSYFGDTVNMAARIEHQCRVFDTWLLISGELLDLTRVPDGHAPELKGTVQLRGRAEETALYTVVRNS